jgi:hypothetical protein
MGRKTLFARVRVRVKVITLSDYNTIKATGLVSLFYAEFNKQFSLIYLLKLKCNGRKTLLARVKGLEG